MCKALSFLEFAKGNNASNHNANNQDNYQNNYAKEQLIKDNKPPGLLSFSHLFLIDQRLIKLLLSHFCEVFSLLEIIIYQHYSLNHNIIYITPYEFLQSSPAIFWPGIEQSNLSREPIF
jgi:hypothetical protein